MKHLIFDFDGTLADSLPIAASIANQMVPQLRLDDQKIAMLRELPTKQIIKASGMPYYRLPRLLVRGKKLLKTHLDELRIFPGIDQAIAQLHKDGYQMSVVSSNSEEIISKILTREGIQKYFVQVYGNVGLFNKTRAFKVVLRDQKITADQAIYIGDEVRDIEAARRGRLTMVAVTWGYNGPTILKKYKPDFVVSRPDQLVKAIKEAK
jgi:HAD superfamily hydrolase (TIGR01549 family)